MISRNNTHKFILTFLVIAACCSFLWAIATPDAPHRHFSSLEDEKPAATIEDTIETQPVALLPTAVPPPDTGLRSPIPSYDNNPLDENQFYSPFHLSTPSAYHTDIVFDSTTNTYRFQNMIGNTPFGPSSSMSIDEYIDYDLRQSISNYWRERGASYTSHGNRRGGGLIPQLHIGGDIFESIFGSNTIDIRPSGNVELIFGVLHNRNDNPSLPVKQRKVTQFNFDENIQLNALAKIGDKIEFNLNYNTEAMFEYENEMKLKFEGKEDDILQLIEFGNVTLPLNSTLITGSQSLFGVKTQLKFGKLMVTAVASEKKAESQTITVTGGAQTNDFYIKADEYDENRHYFLNQYFRDHYNQFLSTLPLVSSPIVITKIEVWRTTIGSATTNNRNIVAFTDLGESNPQFAGFTATPGVNTPCDSANSLVAVIDTSLYRNLADVNNNLHARGLTSGVDYEKVESARLLSTSEYTFNAQLGFISLNTSLTSDQVLAVAYQYTIIGDDHVYQVGEFSNEVNAPQCLRAKLLKSTTLDTKSPLWDLMMKNVYSLNAYQVSNEDFILNVLYTGDDEGVANGFFNLGSQKNIPLIRLLGVDRLNKQQDTISDGIFDFIDNAATQGGTINANNGKIYFPTIEPFGKDLRAVLTEPEIADRYAFDTLYRTTKTLAKQYTAKDKYYLEGSYKSSYGSEISLNAMNVPEGSVKVTAGGITLTENVDYTVNYSMGTVSIINSGVLNSGTPITISLENQSTFATTDQRMFGLNLDYAFSENFNLGATLLNLNERPITQKVNYGDEPINNTIWGMNINYKAKMPWITKAVDLLSFHSTTSESNFQFEGEFAHFIPGHSRAIGKEGTTYIDDFEATKSTTDLRSIYKWHLASTPQGQMQLFPEAHTSDADPARRQLAYGYNRARFCWYIIDPIFYRNNSATPHNLTVDDQSATYAREVYETELFPNKENGTTTPTNISVLNLAFYPSERGPYNYDVHGNEGFSAGVATDGSLNAPDTRWGGIMREMDNTDFESANYEYIEFWMMDPFIDNPNHSGGKLYFNLGDISEDILKDGKKFFENGLPIDGSDENVEYTVWGRVPTIQMIVTSFDNSDEARQWQDVGYDGMEDAREREHFEDNFLSMLNGYLDADAYQRLADDPSSDNFHYFRGHDYDDQDVKILDRYKYYNNADGNSPTDNQSPENYPTSGTNIPNMEDVNNDNTLSEDEKYYQYVVDLRPDRMNIGENYINDIYEASPEPLPNNTRPLTKWYQFKIPIKSPDKVVGNISGFNSIRFMRLFMRDFNEPIICRLATFELVKSDWRTYSLDLMEDGDYLPANGGDETSFNVSSLSFEENGNRDPVPYVIPPGIEREQGYGSTTLYYVNEQALTMKVQNLMDGDARAIYKTTKYDLRKFKKLRMFIHAEKVNANDHLNKGEVTTFIRLGSDFTDNYYEYEIPVEFTPWFCGKDSTAVWPMNNRMEIILDSLVSVKQMRNKEVRNGSHPSIAVPYSVDLDGNRITVVGTPNLADVATIMIGVRNPKKKTLNDGDDMGPKSVEIWVNELRLCDFDDKQGLAALARMRVNLADVGDITLSGTVSTPGFGTLDQSVTETQSETRYTVDFAANLEAGKTLFPEKWNIRIPLHYDLSQNVSIPEYNPLNPDVKLKEDLKTYETMAERDSIRHMTTDFVRRQNVNLMNVRKERNFDKPIKIRPWDIENWDFSYAYSEIKTRNVDVEFDNEFSHQGELGYAYNNNPKNIRPLANQKWLKSKWLQLIRDFNFYPLPKMFTFRTTVLREFNEFKYRPKSKGNVIMDTSFVKTFDWTRDYALRWDLSQGLKFEYTANASARIDEPQGIIDTRAEKDSIWRCFGHAGRVNTFQQRFDASWQVPINKIPLFSWITASARYSSTYDYAATSMALSYLGNTISNSQTLQLNGNVNFVNLYNKVPYLKKINQGSNKNNSKNGKLNAVKGKAAAADEDEGKGKDKDKDDKKGKGKDKKGQDSLKEKPNYGKIILDGSLRFLMMLRNASLSYTAGNGISMPGFMSAPNIMGLNWTNGAPGFLFVFGGQTDIRHISSDRGWLSTDTLMNYAYQENHNRVINFRATVEPFKDFRIDVTANRNESSSYSEYYRADGEGVFHSYTPKTQGNYNITQFGLGKFFTDGDKIFEEFKNIRYELATRLSENNPHSGGVIDTTGYPVGYGKLSQDVLTSAFLAAYAGKNSATLDVSSPFPKLPLPNWRLNYTGFTKIKGVDKVFQSLSITHAYTCTYNIGNYTTNLLYTEDINGNSTALDQLGNFIPSREIGQITISEQLNPLIGFDMTLKNSLMIKVEYKRSRNTSLSFANNQITEMTSNELAVSAGYRIKDITIGFIFSGMKRQVTSDLNLTLSFALKDNQTVLRKIAEEINQISAGSLSMTINFAADYQLSKMVGLTLYYDHIINKPYISQQYNNMNIDAGIKVRLMLAQ